MNEAYNNLTVVLISHKSKNKVINFIKNLSKNFSIIIIDNSNDKDINNEIKKIDGNIKLILSKNDGYGCAINLARKFIKTEYFFVFNPDIRNVTDKFLIDFYKSANQFTKKYGALGPRFTNVKEKSHKQSDVNIKYANIKSISGAAMFFKTSIFDKNNGFDENFFLYFEETDYCWRSTINGFGIYQINDLKVEHDIGSSVEIFDDEEKIKLKELCLWHFIWSKYYLSTKINGHFKSKIFFFPIIIKILLRIFIYNLINQKDKKKKYSIRFDGLINSIKKKKSFKRIEDF